MDQDKSCPLGYLEPSTLSCHIFYVRLDRRHVTVEACANHARRCRKATATAVALQEGGDTRQIRARISLPRGPTLAAFLAMSTFMPRRGEMPPPAGIFQLA